MCKGNCASYVRRNPPYGPTARAHRNGKHSSDSLVNCRYSPGFLIFRFCLTFSMRPNYYYTPEHHPNAQTQPARPEGRRAEAERHAQSPFGNSHRSPVQREPFLRSQRSSAGPLRDAATPQRRSRRRFSTLLPLLAFRALRFIRPKNAFQRSGLAGLLPAQRGPKDGHKLSAEVLDYVASLREADPKLTTVQCVKAVQEHFGITVHRRSLERALARRKKKPHQPDLTSSIPGDAAATYEALRPYLIDPTDQAGATHGPAVLLRHGMLAWASTARQVPALSVSPSPASGLPVPSEISRELVQVMAGLILHHGKDSVLCLN